jgi:hypothetical protein
MKILSDRERLRTAVFGWYYSTEALADTFPPGLHSRAYALLYAKGVPNDSTTEEEFRQILREIHHRPDDAQWPTQVKVARGLDLPNRMSVKRLIDRGKLKTNGAKGKDCRVDPASILAYCEKEGIAYNDT